MMHRLPGCGILALVLLGSAGAAEPLRGYHARVAVTEPTRLDWTFALSNQSLAEPPADWLGDYRSTDQHYELFVPPTDRGKAALPVIVFIAPGNEASGWRSFEATCKQLGILFVGAHGAGNAVPPKKRVRVVLDVLDEVRRHYRTDPDRTYLAGFSGGARIASAVAFALPEHFGGVLAIGGSGDLREEPWLRQRVIDRLSVALVTGETDFNRGELERLRGPMLKEVGVRTRVWVQPKLGHAVPPGRLLTEVCQWLDEGARARRQLAQRWPASRIAGEAAPTRAERAQALLDEAKKRLEEKTTLYSGLMQLQGCLTRWDGLPAAAEARKILLAYEGRKDRPWEQDDLAEQRRFLIARARALDAYASGDLPQQYAKMRPDMLRETVALWELIQKDGPDTAAGREAKRRLQELRKRLGE